MTDIKNKLTPWLGRMRRLVLYLRALRRSLIPYESDMGGWRERIDWEIGNVDGYLGLPCRKPKYDSPYEHGYYCGNREKSFVENVRPLAPADNKTPKQNGTL